MSGVGTPMEGIPNPGSDEARAQGCICGRMDNNYGRYPPWPGEGGGWWITEGCPVHASGPRPGDVDALMSEGDGVS